MNKALAFAKYLRIEERIALFLIALVVCINTIVFHNTIGFSVGFLQMVRYFSFGKSFFLVFSVVLLILFLWNLIEEITIMVSEYVFRHKRPGKAEMRELLGLNLELFRTLAPLAIVPSVSFTLLANLDVVLRLSGHDLTFLAIDHALTGLYIFMDVPTVFSSPIYTAVVLVAYTALSFIVGFVFALLYIRGTTHLYREAVIAFFFTLVIAFPIFSLFPCQDPNNYFVRNLQHNILPSALALRVQQFHPSEELRSYIATIAQAETGSDNTVPVSCFPSMHATWGLLVLYYLYRMRRSTLFVTTPWFVLMLLGGLTLNQHYLVDYLASVPCMLFAVLIAKWIMKKYGTIGTPMKPFSAQTSRSPLFTKRPFIKARTSGSSDPTV